MKQLAGIYTFCKAGMWRVESEILSQGLLKEAALFWSVLLWMTCSHRAVKRLRLDEWMCMCVPKLHEYVQVYSYWTPASLQKNYLI